MSPFTDNVINIISSIPAGKVMTYGQIARVAGNPRAARQVVRILHSMSDKYLLPWHRVVNSKGQIGFQDEEMQLNQRNMLEAEGIMLKKNNAIPLETYIWEPDATNVH